MSNGQPVTEGSASELCGIIDKSGPLMGWAVKEAANRILELWTPDVAHKQDYIEHAIFEAKRSHRVKKDTAGDLGTEIHMIVGSYIEGQLFLKDIKSKDKKRALQNFIKTTKGWEWLGSEIVVVSEWCECPGKPHDECLHNCPNLRGYGGTADAIARLPDGQIHLIDFKTSNTIQATFSMQCALYAYAKPVDDNLKPVWEEIQEARILHFNKEFLTWENLERNISEQRPFIQSFIGCRRWKKRFDVPSYSNYKDKT